MSLIGDTKLSILLRLREAPSHGYELAHELDISQGYVYRHLDELEDAGMISVVQKEQSGRGRVTYGLTENGEMLLEALGE